MLILGTSNSGKMGRDCEAVGREGRGRIPTLGGADMRSVQEFLQVIFVRTRYK